MLNKSIKHVIILGLAGLCGVLFLQTSSRADTVLPGYDLFTTDQTGLSSFDGYNFVGVPLVYYNFGGSIGQQFVFTTDTIMQRMGTSGDGQTVDLVMDALQLESTTPMFGPGIYGFITLDPNYASGGTVTINNDFTYSTTFNVYFDIHEGSLNGPIYEGVQEISDMTGSGDWQHPQTPGALTIQGVNYLLNGTDASEDFWPIGPADCSAPGDIHDVYTTVPEPSSLALLGVGAVSLLAREWRRRTAKA